MVKEAIYHLMDSNYAYPIDVNTLVIRIRAKKGDIKHCILFYGDRCCETNPIVMSSTEMHLKESDGLYDYFECNVWTEYKRVCYYFLLDDGIETVYYYSDEFHKKVDNKLPGSRTKYYQYGYIRQNDVVKTPDWVKSSIIYQIFPDSFATGKGCIIDKGKEIISSDGTKSVSRLGGTIRGIIENLDYLKDLGVNCLYLNPIFKAASYHKYDIYDYYDIDPTLGTKEDFRELVARCHKDGIKIMLDGVFNHTSVDFFAFKDLIQNGQSSAYKDWYLIKEFPIKVEYPPNYETFAYVPGMPRLNTSNPEVRNYFINVAKYWITEFDIDGWRLDVASEIDHTYWQEFRKNIKSVKCDAFIIAEIWEDANSYLNGDQFDSSMDYNFMNLCEQFFAFGCISVSEFSDKLSRLRLRYKKPIQQCLMNLLDTHDVKRFMFVCNGDFRRLRLASFFQFMYVGVPSIYYGDEVGLSGLTEKEYRRKMEWDVTKQNIELKEHYKRIINIRKKHDTLVFGDFETKIVDNINGIFAFSRKGKEKFLIVMNNSVFKRNVEINCPGIENAYDLYNERNVLINSGKAAISLEPFGASVILY